MLRSKHKQFWSASNPVSILNTVLSMLMFMKGNNMRELRCVGKVMGSINKPFERVNNSVKLNNRLPIKCMTDTVICRGRIVPENLF